MATQSDLVVSPTATGDRGPMQRLVEAATTLITCAADAAASLGAEEAMPEVASPNSRPFIGAAAALSDDVEETKANPRKAVSTLAFYVEGDNGLFAQIVDRSVALHPAEMTQALADLVDTAGPHLSGYALATMNRNRDLMVEQTEPAIAPVSERGVQGTGPALD